jgi:hypothetical protein
MKFPGIYAILNNRGGISVKDVSAWKSGRSDYISRIRPLWIIVTDAKINKRIWITKDRCEYEVATAQLDLNPKSREYIYSYRRAAFTTQRDTVKYLNTLFGNTEETL